MAAVNRGPRRERFLTCLCLILVVVVLGGLLVWSLRPEAALYDLQAAVRPNATRGELDADEKATVDLFRRSAPSVANITTIALALDIFTLDVLQISEGTGSGFIWDDTGTIVTNFHVIQNVADAEVTLADHSTWKAKRIAMDGKNIASVNDLFAFLQDHKVGDTVTATLLRDGKRQQVQLTLAGPD
jgi:S1-C subfamily serine protease